MNDIQLLNIDCMEYMANLEDKYFDLAIVDPPYGINGNSHRKNRRSVKAQSTDFHMALWDQPRPTIEYFRELERISKNQIIFGGNHLMDLIGKSSPCWIVWNKYTSGSFADCELAYTSFDSAVRKFNYPWNGMIQGYHGYKILNEKRIHPTQKPIALYDWILKNYSNPNEKIIDTHLGSGSSAIASFKNRNYFVGCEIDKIYYDGAIKRFAEETKQMNFNYECST